LEKQTEGKQMKAFRLLALGVSTMLAGCFLGDPPPLETFPGHVPQVRDLEDHISCEMLPLVAAVKFDERRQRYYLDAQLLEGDPRNSKMLALYYEHPELAQLLPKLVEYSFIASVSMVLDVTDTEGVSPSLSFIEPFNAAASLNRTLGIGASLNATQEHNQTFNYTVNLAKLSSGANGLQCYGPLPPGGLEGDLGLVSDVVSGLLSLDASANLNIAGSASPIISSVSQQFANDVAMNFSGNNSAGDKFGTSLTVTEAGLTFSPPASGSQGTLTLTGTGTTGDGIPYFINLTGSAFQKDRNAPIPFSITGTLTQSAFQPNSELGFGPKLTLAGDINISKQGFAIALKSGSLIADTATLGTWPALFLVNAISPQVKKVPTQSYSTLSSFLAGGITSAAGGSTAAGASKGSSGGAVVTGSSTQFSTFENFQISYGVNGGPTWTLLRFKGPVGGNSPLLTGNRSDSDSLTITLVAACRQNGENNFSPANYWQAIPVCDSSGTLQTLAGINGQTFNTYRTR
jgi:hypothetical protein